MFDSMYLTARSKNKVICAGLIVNHKYDLTRKQYLYSVDNVYYFFNNANVQCSIIDSKIEPVLFNPDCGLKVLPWADRDKQADVFKEHTCKEIDQAIASLVIAINNYGIVTTGSCSGHGEGPAWVTMAFTDLSTMIDFCSLVRHYFKTDQVNLEVPSEFSHDSIMNLNLVIPFGKIEPSIIYALIEFLSIPFDRARLFSK